MRCCRLKPLSVYRYSIVRKSLFKQRCISDYISRVSKAQTVSDFRQLIKAMHTRQYNLRKIQIGLVCFGGFFAYLFYEKIVDWLSDQTTTVTSKSLEDPEFLDKIVEFGTKTGKRIVYNLTQDDDTKQVFAEFFKELFTSQPIVDAASTLSERTVKRLLFEEQFESFRRHIIDFALEGAHEIIEDEKTKHNAGNLLWSGFNKAFNPIVWIFYAKPEDKSSKVEKKQ